MLLQNFEKTSETDRSNIFYSWTGIFWLAYFDFDCWYFYHDADGRILTGLLSTPQMLLDSALSLSNNTWIVTNCDTPLKLEMFQWCFLDHFFYLF